MNKKLKVVIIAAAVALLIGLIWLMLGNNSSQQHADSGKTQIKIWTNTRHDMAVREEQVRKFNDRHDSIEVILEVMADNYSDMLNLSFQNNMAPDIFIMADAILDPAIERGWLRPFDDELIEEYSRDFLPGAMYRNPITNDIYSINLTKQVFRMIYNKDLFKKAGLNPDSPPTTWAQFREYAKAITAVGEGSKFGFAMPLRQPVFTRFYIMNPGAPSGLYNLDGFDLHKGEYDFTIYERMINLMLDIQADGSMFPTPSTLDNDTARAQFAAGNIGLMFAATWDIAVFNEQFPAQIEWGVADFPTFDGTVTGGFPFSIGGAAYAMNANSADSAAQLEVYKWFMSEEVMRELAEAGTGVFTRTVLSDIAPSGLVNAAELAEVTFPIHLMDQPAYSIPRIGNTLEGEGYSDVMKNIITGNLNVKEELQALTDRYNDALRLLKEADVRDGFDPNRYTRDDFQFILPSLDWNP